MWITLPPHGHGFGRSHITMFPPRPPSVRVSPHVIRHGTATALLRIETQMDFEGRQAHRLARKQIQLSLLDTRPTRGITLATSGCGARIRDPLSGGVDDSCADQ